MFQINKEKNNVDQPTINNNNNDEPSDNNNNNNDEQKTSLSTISSDWLDKELDKKKKIRTR